MACIYKITSPSGMAYIGKTVNFHRRMIEHQGKGSSCGAIKSAIQKYGWENMKAEILLYCAEEDCPMYEKTMMAAYDTFGENGYNMSLWSSTRKNRNNKVGNSYKLFFCDTILFEITVHALFRSVLFIMAIISRWKRN
tara:strand:- start:387 stop:800 length:414 start_codon:yes stop_codon:yes gene_type:complete